MVLTFEFDDADEACEMEYAFRDAWGHKFDTKWDGDVEVYVEVDDPSDESTPVLFFDKDYTEKRGGSLMESRTRSGRRMLKESDVESAKEALADYLKVPVSAISVSDEYDYYRPDHEFEVETDEGTRVYCVYDDRDSAYKAAINDLEERFQDTPEILAAAIEYFGNTALSFFSSDSEQDEEIRNRYDEMNSEEFAENVANMYVDGDLVPFNFRGFAEHNIENLGIEWHLADYDGKENVLGNGMLAYREE